MKLLLPWLILSLAYSSAYAENNAKSSTRSYQVIGVVAQPKVPVSWNTYHTVEECENLMRQMSMAYPKLCKLQSIGKSHEMRDLWLLTITDESGGRPEDKAAFWIDGGIHANEMQASEVALYTAWYLLEMAANNKTVSRLLKERVFYILPVFNPDSRVAHMVRPNTTHSPRSGQMPVDDDRDGMLDEDGPDDLDGDGNITQMRVRDPQGKHKGHPDFPEYMILADKGEPGEYTMLGEEGFDNDGDGQVNEDGDGYYDPNRNFPWSWGPGYVQQGSYRYPLSLTETRAMADFVLAHPHIAGLQTYHNTGGMFIYGPGDASQPYEGADEAVFARLASEGEKMIPGYKAMRLAGDVYPACGTEIDWAYAMLGIVGFNNELFTAFRYFNKKPSDFFGTEIERHQFNRSILLEEGFVPWREVDHPRFGKVEVGGFKKSWQRQPPSFMLEEECHRNMAFTLYHADHMPKVLVGEPQVERLEGGLTRVTVTLQNKGLIPTRLAVDVKNKLSAPDMASISGDGLRVLAGLTSRDGFRWDSREQKERPGALAIDAIPGYGMVSCRWLVAGYGKFNIEFKSSKGGCQRVEADTGAAGNAHPAKKSGRLNARDMK